MTIINWSVENGFQNPVVQNKMDYLECYSARKKHERRQEKSILTRALRGGIWDDFKRTGNVIALAKASMEYIDYSFSLDKTTNEEKLFDNINDIEKGWSGVLRSEYVDEVTKQNILDRTDSLLATLANENVNCDLSPSDMFEANQLAMNIRWLNADTQRIESAWRAAMN